MNKENKFRAWDKSKKKWIENFELASDGSIGYTNMFGTYELLYDAELEQCTGFEGKNRKEIYKSDIVKYHFFYFDGQEESEREIIGVVEYYQNDCCFVIVDLDNGDIHHFASASDNGIEVIGNIYENPELLNKKNI